jgi:hypothetical protein
MAKKQRAHGLHVKEMARGSITYSKKGEKNYLLKQLSQKNKKFWEELIVCFPFTAILVPDMRRNKILVGMPNKVNKLIQFSRLQCCCYWWG